MSNVACIVCAFQFQQFNVNSNADCPPDYHGRDSVWPEISAPHIVCKEYLGTGDLERIFSKIFGYNSEASVIYHRIDESKHSMNGFAAENWTQDVHHLSKPSRIQYVCPRTRNRKASCAGADAIEDWEFIARHHPRVLSTDKLHIGNISWNEMQNTWLAWSDCYISVQGGAFASSSTFALLVHGN